jgi:hypothetical protein
MLGTNDLKGRFALGARDIAAGAGLLLDMFAPATAARGSRSCPWIDAGAHVRSSDVDGIHLDAPSHEQLGVVVAQHLRRLLA